jgi:hypothetical protein
LRHIERNGRLVRPDQTPTKLTETEVNAYLADGRVELPEGVQRVEFHASPGIVRAVVLVDFDAITASRRSANPLLALFSGTHEVQVQAQASGSGGMGTVHVESVEIGGVPVPRAALEIFLSRYITPKYPQVRLDTRFRMPHRIDLAIVGRGELTLTQK